MHEKLSQAVKLYDKLLTDQISHPAWRRTSPEQDRASTLPTGPTHAPNRYAQPQGSSGYDQWAPSSPVYAPRGDPTSSQVPQSPTVQTSSQPSYVPPPPPLLSTSGYSHLPYSYNPSAVEQEPHRQMTSPPQPLLSGAQESQGYQPVSILQAIPPTPLGGNLGRLDDRGQGLAAKSMPPPHESHLQPVMQPAPTASAPALPSPVLPASTSPGRSTIARAHTISSRPSIVAPPPPAQLQSSLSRSTTVSYAPTTHTHPQSFSRTQLVHTLQHLSHPPPPQPQLNPSLPAFPTVPTSTPQTFDLFAPSVPSAPPQERREETLIEL